MPFSDRWFYGDTLFIIDVWLWSVLALGIWLARKRRRRGLANTAAPALAAIGAVAIYTAAMGAASQLAERFVTHSLVAQGNPAPSRVLASPVPINPFRRSILFETGGKYGFGELRWTPSPSLMLEPGLEPTRMDDPAIAAATAQDSDVASFLYWSRYPFAEIERKAGSVHVIIGDARYNRRPSDGRFSVRATINE